MYLDSLDTCPSCISLFLDNCTDFNPAGQLKVVDIAVKKLITEFVDLSYPEASTDDNARGYAKEVLSLGCY